MMSIRKGVPSLRKYYYLPQWGPYAAGGQGHPSCHPQLGRSPASSLATFKNKDVAMGSPLRYARLRANPAVASLNLPPRNPHGSGETSVWSLRPFPDLLLFCFP